jgi:hypothetical protein
MCLDQPVNVALSVCVNNGDDFLSDGVDSCAAEKIVGAKCDRRWQVSEHD